MIYKVTLKLYLPEYEGGPWIDGPVSFMDAKGLEEFSKEHTHFKVEMAKWDEIPAINKLTDEYN